MDMWRATAMTIRKAKPLFNLPNYLLEKYPNEIEVDTRGNFHKAGSPLIKLYFNKYKGYWCWKDYSKSAIISGDDCVDFLIRFCGLEPAAAFHEVITYVEKQ